MFCSAFFRAAPRLGPLGYSDGGFAKDFAFAKEQPRFSAGFHRQSDETRATGLYSSMLLLTSPQRCFFFQALSRAGLDDRVSVSLSVSVSDSLAVRIPPQLSVWLTTIWLLDCLAFGKGISISQHFSVFSGNFAFSTRTWVRFRQF